ncbi:MAG: hypothetical protein U0232_21390 [Thermomicrobiales bacterium]
MREVMAGATCAGSRFPVAGSISTKIGFAPRPSAALAVAMKV